MLNSQIDLRFGIKFSYIVCKGRGFCVKARTNCLRQYVKFVEDKTYLKVIDKYEEIREVIEENDFNKKLI